MSKTARMVMKIVGASLALAAFVCLLIGGWHDLTVGCCGLKSRVKQKFTSEYDDYADEELYEEYIKKSPTQPGGGIFLFFWRGGQN